MSKNSFQLKLRSFARRSQQKRPAIFLSVFECLKPGASFEFINDYEPIPLHRQVQQLQPTDLIWEAVAAGPDVWSVRIIKKLNGEVPEKKSCCGVCGD